MDTLTWKLEGMLKVVPGKLWEDLESFVMLQ